MGGQEAPNDSLLDGRAPGEWTYQKTGQKSGVVYGELIAQNKDFKEIPCPDLCFDQIRVTGFPQESFFYSRLFTELNRLLHPQGKLCFTLAPLVKDAWQAQNVSTSTGKIDPAKAEETIIYYGMKSGFSFTEKELPSERRRKDAKKPCYSLYLTLTNPYTPNPVSTATQKSSPTLLWFVKEQSYLNSEAAPSPEL